MRQGPLGGVSRRAQPQGAGRKPTFVHLGGSHRRAQTQGARRTKVAFALLSLLVRWVSETQAANAERKRRASRRVTCSDRCTSTMRWAAVRSGRRAASTR